MGIGIEVDGLTKTFGSQPIWEDVTFDIPAGEVSVLLGPWGTGESAFLKSLIGLLWPSAARSTSPAKRRSFSHIELHERLG